MPGKTTTKYLGLLIAILPSLLMAQTTGPVGEPPYNPPEFYERIRSLRKKIIAEQRDKVDLASHPRYRTVVRDGDTHRIVERMPHTIEINKQNGVIDQVVLLEESLSDGCALADLEMTGADGEIYRQSLSRDARVEFQEENTYLLWTVRFSPSTVGGRALGLRLQASYRLFKIAGYVTVRYLVLEGDAEVRQVVIRNSVGRTKSPLHIVYSAFFRDNDGDFNDTMSLPVKDLEPRLVMAGKIPAPMWTNGSIGFMATALRETWEESHPLTADSSLKNCVVRTRDGRRAIDFHFVNSDRPVALLPGRTFSSGFSLLPFQRYQPMLPLVDRGIRHVPSQFRYLNTGEKADENAVVSSYRTGFWKGGIFVGTGIASAGWTPLMYAVTKEPYYSRTKRVIALGREAELVLGTASCIVNSFPKPSEKEVGAVTEEFLQAYASDGFATLSTAAQRDFWLDIRVSTLEVFDVDGDYEDLHAHIDVGGEFTSQVEGEVRYLEDIALLHEHYGREKIIIAHAGNILTPADGMNAATWPGEPWTGQNFRELPEEVLDSYMNPFLVGTDVCFYGPHFIYDLGSLKLCKQILRNAIVPQNAAVHTEDGERNWNRYFIPGRIFRTDQSNFVSWRDPQARNYFEAAAVGEPGSNEDGKKSSGRSHVNLYHRPGEAYVTSVDMRESPSRHEIVLQVDRLGFTGTEVFVFDTIHRRLEVVPVENGRAKYRTPEATAEPVLLYFKDKVDDTPQIIWSHYSLQFEQTQSVSDSKSALPGARWKFNLPVLPHERRTERFWMYCGDFGRPRALHPFGEVYVHRFHEDQKSMDLIFRLPAATEGGPMGMEGKLVLDWNKPFQMSFPVLGE